MDRNGFTFRRKTTQSQRFLGEKKMKSALDNNPHSIIICNFREKKMKSAGCFQVKNWVFYTLFYKSVKIVRDQDFSLH